MADPQIKSVQSVTAPKITKITYLGTQPVSGEVLQQNDSPSLVSTTPTASQIVGEARADAAKPAEQNFFENVPALFGGALGGGAGAALKLSLLKRALLSGLGGVAGESGAAATQKATGSPYAPNSWDEFLNRIEKAGGGQFLTELGFGLLGKPLDFALRGALKDSEGLNRTIANVNHDYNLRLTAPEITNSSSGRLAQRVATSALFGQPTAEAATAEGTANLKNLTSRQLEHLSDIETPIAAGNATKATLGQNAKLISEVLGGNVGRTAEALSGQQVNIAPLKDWIRGEQERLQVVNKFLGQQGDTAAERLAAKSLGYESAAQAKQNLPPSVWEGLVNASSGMTQSAEDFPLTNATKLLGRPDTTSKDILSDIMKMPDSVPFEVANKLKQDLFSLNPTTPTAFKDQAVGIAKQANKKLTGLMEAAATAPQPNPNVLYHGARASSVPGIDASGKLQGSIWMTEDPNYARFYAGDGGKVYAINKSDIPDEILQGAKGTGTEYNIGSHMGLEIPVQPVQPNPAGQAWINARNAYRQARQLFQKNENQPYEGKFIQSLIEAKPSEIIEKIKDPEDVQALRKAFGYASLGGNASSLEARQTFQGVQRNYIQGLLHDPQATVEGMDLIGLKQRLQQANAKGTLDAMFKDNPEALNNLKTIAEVASRYQNAGRINSIGLAVALHAAATGATSLAGVTSHDFAPTLISGMAFEGIPAAMAKVIYSPKATELFLNGLAGLARDGRFGAVGKIPGELAFRSSPYLGTAMADIYRAFQIANANDAAKASQNGKPRQGTQSTVSPAGQ